MQKSDFPHIRQLGKKLKQYARFRIFFFGFVVITYAVIQMINPKIEALNLDNLTDLEFFKTLGGDMIFWLIFLLLLIFALGIFGFLMLLNYARFVGQLKRTSTGTSSLFLRKIYITAAINPIIWFILLFFLNSLYAISFNMLSFISAGLTLYTTFQFKKWIDTFGDYGLKKPKILSLLMKMNLWMICLVSFMLISIIQIFGILNGAILVLIGGTLLLGISVVLYFFGNEMIGHFD